MADIRPELPVPPYQPRSRSPTAIASAPAFLVALAMSLFALVVSALALSPTSALMLLPLAATCAYVVARIHRGAPVTLRGVVTSASESSTQRSQTNSRTKEPRFLLVAMPVNHFGEKLRWCLDLLGAPYEESTVGGLLSAFLRGRSVPWLVDRQSCSIIGNSDEGDVPDFVELTR